MSDTGAPAKTALTPRETELAVLALQCLESGLPKLNWDKFVEVAEFKNKNSARVSFNALLREKLSKSTTSSFYVAHASAAATTNSTPKKRSPQKKVKAPTPNDSANDANEPTTPKKRGKKAGSEAPISKRAKRSPEVKAEEDINGQDQEMDSKEGHFDAAYAAAATP